jgi:hypothetical protein
VAGSMFPGPADGPAASGGGTAPPIVDAALASPGRPVDPRSRAYFEPRLGVDLSAVRVHDDATAASAARALDAAAFTVGSDVVFAADAPPGGRLLAHELAHVTQAMSSKTTPRMVLRQGGGTKPPPKPRDPTLDEIAQEIGAALGGPHADYAAYAGTMVSGSFLGHPIDRGVRTEFLAKLGTAKTNIDAEFKKSGTTIPAGYGITSVGGFRWASGPHGWGLAIDLDVAGNPYVMHEHNEATLDAQLAPVYNRIADFMLNSPVGGQQSIIPSDITKRADFPGKSKQSRSDRLGDYYDRFALESQAMKDYFALMKNPAPNAVANFLAGPWAKTHPGAAPPAAADVLKQMWEDYATLGGQVPTGGPPGVTGYTAPGAIGKADRPFAPHSGTQQDPAAGFLTIPREVVVGLGRTVTRWGAIDFGGESGDVQHFDDMEGLGAEIAAATRRAKAKIAAAATPASTSTSTP